MSPPELGKLNVALVDEDGNIVRNLREIQLGSKVGPASDYNDLGERVVELLADASRKKQEVSPVESLDGSRTTFTVPESWVQGTLEIYRNGSREIDVTIDRPNNQFTLENTQGPESFEDLWVDYEPAS